MKKIYLFIFVLLLTVNTSAQRKSNNFTVMFYNVENLFDTINDPITNDDEFTPKSEKVWDIEKYDKKLTDITRVIMSLPNKELPAIIGFAEVENKAILQELAEQRGLNRKEYQAILVDDNDPRGIDVGILYRPDMFKYRSHSIIPVPDLSGKDYPLRGILHVTGKGPDGKPLHIYVNHWKSRYGGVKETEHLRVYSAIALRRELDRLLSSESNPRFILMGDFNDEPTNKSMVDILHTGNKRKNPWINDAYNLYYDRHNMDSTASYAYQGQWQQYDQIIVSYTLLNQDSDLTTSFTSGRILNEEWMIFYDEENDIKIPNRTYGGPNYYGGISDHFPVYVNFTY